MGIADLDGRLTITIEEFAQLTGIGRSAAYAAAARNEIPTRRIGRRVLVPVPLFRAWLGLEDGAETAHWIGE